MANLQSQGAWWSLHGHDLISHGTNRQGVPATAGLQLSPSTIRGQNWAAWHPKGCLCGPLYLRPAGRGMSWAAGGPLTWLSTGIYLLSSSPSMAAPPSDNTYLQCGKPGNRENSWRSKDSCIRTMVGHKQNIPSFCCFHSKHHYREEDLGSTSQIELYISIETSPVLY